MEAGSSRGPRTTDKPTLTFNQTVRGIAEFIEVAMHMILYVRQVYPAELFARRKKYNTPVYQSRHPLLNEYISGAIKALTQEIATGNVEKIILVIKDTLDVPLERFIFSINNMIQVDIWDKNISVDDAMDSLVLGHHFRAFLIKLSMLEAQLGPLNITDDDDVTFAIVMELKDGTQPTSSSNTTYGQKKKLRRNPKSNEELPPWIPANKGDTTHGASDDDELTMIRAVDTGIINMSLSVQESVAKLERGLNQNSQQV